MSDGKRPLPPVLLYLHSMRMNQCSILLFKHSICDEVFSYAVAFNNCLNQVFRLYVYCCYFIVLQLQHCKRQTNISCTCYRYFHRFTSLVLIDLRFNPLFIIHSKYSPRAVFTLIFIHFKDITLFCQMDVGRVTNHFGRSAIII